MTHSPAATEHEDRNVRIAVERFPRGLRQAPGRARFSLDALLLGAFAARCGGPDFRAADLGAGCGAAGFAFLLLTHTAHVLGIERAADQVDAARANAEALGLGERYEVRELDLADVGASGLEPEICDLILANPPYYRPGQGRPPRDESRKVALIQEPGGLEAFVAGAAWLAKNRGMACFIYTAEGAAELMAALGSLRLIPKTLLPVSSRAGEPARLVLLETRKNGGPGLRIDPPLVLYQGQGQDTELTPEALEFCPFLACNAGPRNPS